MRAILDGLYRASSAAAAVCLCVIASLVLVQVFGRILDGTLRALSLPIAGVTVPSLNEIAGFLFVAATFLALAATLRQADHIRVSMLIKAVPLGVRRILEAVVLIIATAIAAYAAYHAVLQVVDSIQFNTVSFGVIAIPLWIPQTALAIGLVVFAIALADELITVITSGTPTYQAHEEAKSEILQKPVITPEDAERGMS
ncbi:MAG: TRAP transporter small permease [Hyphomicrobiales bacterium]|jgi:TRAP-type C4-dicarboxylate transport system permease small subunit